MKEFKFSIDEKCSIWYRSSISIYAETLEDATAEIKKRIKNDLPELLKDSEPLYETVENMTPKENGGYSTLDVFTNDINGPVFSNGK